MIYARINVNVDTGVYLFLHISCGTEYSQHSNALAHPNPSANSNKFKLLPYHCYANGFGAFAFFSISAKGIFVSYLCLTVEKMCFGGQKSRSGSTPDRLFILPLLLMP